MRPDEKDPYVTGLVAGVRGGRDERLLDRLVMAAVVEARGCERFGLVAGALTDPKLTEMYRDIVRSEARHQGLFLRLARCYFDEVTIRAALDRWLDREAQILAGLTLRPALH